MPCSSTDHTVTAIEMDMGKMSLQERRKPVDQKEWDSFFDPVTGRLHISTDEVKEKIFHGGLDAEDGVRKEAWLFLLGAFKWDSTKEDRQRITLDMRDKYMRLKGQWWERLADGIGTEEQQEWWREQRNRIGTEITFDERLDRQADLYPILRGARDRKGRPPHRPQPAALRRRGLPAPRPELAVRRGRH